MRETLFLCIPTYVFTSDLLRTRYIEYLSHQYRVVVFTPMIGETEAKEGRYFQSPNVAYIKWRMENPRFWSLFKLFRIAAISEFDYLASTQHFYKRPTFKHNRKRRLIRFVALPFGRILTADFFTGLEKFLLTRSKQFREYLKRYQPNLLITATPGFNPVEAEMILLAKKEKLPTVAVNFTWDNLTTNSNHIRKTDYLITWNKIVKQEAVEIHHYSPERVWVSGVIKFGHYFVTQPGELTRREFLRRKKLDPKNKTIVFASKPKAYSEQLEHIRGIVAARDQGRFAVPVNILIRPHPLDNPDFYAEFSKLPNVWVDQPGTKRNFTSEPISNNVEMDEADMLNLKHTLMYGDVHLQYGSTLALEAAIFDKPVVNIGFLKTLLHNESYTITHYRPVLESGAAPLARNLDELISRTNEYLIKPAQDREPRTKLVDDYLEFQDNLSYKRNVDFLEKIISRTKA